MSVRRPIRFVFGLLLGILLVPGADAAHETEPPACPAYRNVPEDRSPHVSRDGTTLAWIREFPRGGARMLVSGPDGSRPRRMNFRGELSALSPDGREALLIEARSRRGEWTYLHYLANTATGDARRISEKEVTATRRLWRTPEWSPDGGSYVDVKYFRDGPTIHELWLVPADGGPGLKLFTPVERLSPLDSPAWSPDGNTIAFLSQPTDGADNHSTVWTVRRDGTGAQQVTNTQDTYQVVWSPNGRLLALTEQGATTPARSAWCDRTAPASAG